MHEGAAPRRFYINRFLSDQFVKRLNAGLIPWRRPWIGKVPLQNGMSGHQYQGLNVFQLTMASIENGFRQPYWLTWNQVRKRGGEILPEHKRNGTLFVFFKDFPIRETIRAEDPKTGELIDETVERTVPLLRYGTLFNIAQCGGLKAADLPAYRAEGRHPGQTEGHLSGETVAQRAVAFLKCAPGLTVDIAASDAAQKAFYDPLDRTIVTPPPSAQESDAAFAFGLFKAAASAVGGPGYLDQPTRGDRRDDPRKDLIAELAAGLLCGKAGIRPPQKVDQDTLNGWIQALEADPRLLLRAGIQAQKAVALVLGAQQPQTQTPPTKHVARGTFTESPLPESRPQAPSAAFTAIDVIYRDAANYKQFESYVVEGELRFRDLEPYLKDGVYFVGTDVQMENLVFRFVERDGMDLNEGDQPWQAIEAVDLTTRERAVEAKGQGRWLGKAAGLLERFRRAAEANWPAHDEVAAQIKRYIGLDPQPVQDEAERQDRTIGY